MKVETTRIYKIERQRLLDSLKVNYQTMDPKLIKMCINY